MHVIKKKTKKQNEKESNAGASKMPLTAITAFCLCLENDYSLFPAYSFLG